MNFITSEALIWIIAAVVSFIITLIFIIRVQAARKDAKQSVPAPLDTLTAVSERATPIREGLLAEMADRRKKTVIVRALFLLISLILFFGFVYMSYRTIMHSEAEIDYSAQTETHRSRGIIIYTADWVEITADEVSANDAGELLYIGIETIPDSDITKARIKVNDEQWKVEHITALYDQTRGVFYMPYTITQENEVLEIEAQLYSNNAGWLED